MSNVEGIVLNTIYINQLGNCSPENMPVSVFVCVEYLVQYGAQYSAHI